MYYRVAVRQWADDGSISISGPTKMPRSFIPKDEVIEVHDYSISVRNFLTEEEAKAYIDELFSHGQLTEHYYYDNFATSDDTDIAYIEAFGEAAETGEMSNWWRKAWK